MHITADRTDEPTAPVATTAAGETAAALPDTRAPVNAGLLAGVGGLLLLDVVFLVTHRQSSSPSRTTR